MTSWHSIPSIKGSSKDIPTIEAECKEVIAKYPKADVRKVLSENVLPGAMKELHSVVNTDVSDSQKFLRDTPLSHFYKCFYIKTLLNLVGEFLDEETREELDAADFAIECLGHELKRHKDWAHENRVWTA